MFFKVLPGTKNESEPGIVGLRIAHEASYSLLRSFANLRKGTKSLNS